MLKLSKTTGVVLIVLAMIIWLKPVLGGEAHLPFSFGNEIEPLESVPLLTLPAIDAKALLAEDEKTFKDAGPGPLRVASPYDLSVTPAKEGKWEKHPDGGRVWRLRIYSPEATDLSVGFIKYHMPKGGELYFFSDNEQYVRGPYTDKDNYDHGQLWLPVIPGDSAVIELYVPESGKDEPVLELSRVGRGYRDMFRMFGADKQGTCNIDVVCPEGDP